MMERKFGTVSPLLMKHFSPRVSSRRSRAVFARELRINERTLEKWEQGRAKPNPQAAALVLLVRKYPDTLDRLDQLAAE